MKVETVQMAQVHLSAADLSQLTKPRITLMVLITMAAGAFLADPAGFSPLLVSEALLATGLLASAASALNQVLETREDALMERTRDRPLAAGRVDRTLVISLACASTAIALLILAWRVNPLTALLGAITSFSYLFLYTPLKKRTVVSTLVGAVPGALPPVMGWAAASGRIDAGAWVLFGMLFLWQVPHFLAIAWIYREDYGRGGFRVLPVLDPKGGWTAATMVVFTVLLVGVTLLGPGAGVFDTIGVTGAVAAGLGFLFTGIDFARHRSRQAARRVLLASVIYLPAVLAISLLDYLPGL